MSWCSFDKSKTLNGYGKVKMTIDLKSKLSAGAVTEPCDDETGSRDSVMIFSIAAETDLHQEESWLEGSLVASSVMVKSMKIAVGAALRAFCRAKKITEKNLQAEIAEKARAGEVAISVAVSRGFLGLSDFFSSTENFVTEFSEFFQRAIDVSNRPVENPSTHWRELAEVELRNDQNANGLVECAMTIANQAHNLPPSLLVIAATGEPECVSKQLTAHRGGFKPVNTRPFEVKGEVFVNLTGYDFSKSIIFAFFLDENGKKRVISITDEQLREIRALVDGRTMRKIELSGQSIWPDASILDADDLTFIRIIPDDDRSR